MKQFKNFLLAVGSFIVMAVLFQIWFKDWILVGIFMSAIALHELGHIITLAKFGFKTSLVFIPYMGAATIPLDQEAHKNMHWYKSSLVYLSGPLVNFVIALIAIVVNLFIADPEISRYCFIATGLNATLGAFNLWPIGSLDGGRFAQNLFESLEGKYERVFVQTIRFALIAVVLILILMGRIPSVVSIIAIFWTIGKASEKDDEQNAYSQKAMSRIQARNLTFAYISMLAVMLIIIDTSPNWLELTNITVWPFFVILGVVLLGSLLLYILSRRNR